MSHNTKVHRPQGGERLVIDPDGILVVDGEEFTGAELKAVLSLVKSIPTAAGEGGTIYNNNGVLTVSKD